MKDIILNLYDILSSFILYIGLICLVFMLLSYILALVCRSINIISKGTNIIATSLLIMIAVIVGGTKPDDTPKATVYHDEGLINVSYKIDTNDLRMITFTWGKEEWVPYMAIVKGYVWDKNSSYVGDFDNGTLIFNVPIMDETVNVIMESDATNYVYYLEQSFIPDAPVVTNGVYHIHSVGGNNIWMPIGLTIKEDSRIISPHKEKQ